MDKIITSRLHLQKLTIGDAEAICHIYNNKKVATHFAIETIETDAEKKAFTERIITNSHFIWTVRLSTAPNLIIGDCALHHLNGENNTIEIGGSLLPEYWGYSLMGEAFSAIIQFATANTNIKYIVGRTDPPNRQAIRCLQKLGFKIAASKEKEVRLTLPVLHSNYSHD